MPVISTYSSPQPDNVLLGGGPKINIIDIVSRRIKFSRGQAVVCGVGQVVNDNGNVNNAFQLKSMNELGDKYGGYAAWMGGPEYTGDLYSQLFGLKHDNVVICIPDMAIKDAVGVDTLVQFDRQVAGPAVSIPAGTRIQASVSSEIVALLEDVSWKSQELGVKSVRVRQVSALVDLGMDTYNTLLDGALPANVTITSIAGTPTETVATVRYQAAFDAITLSMAGQTASIVFCDQSGTAYNDIVTDHATAQVALGYFRIAVVSPGTTTVAASESNTAAAGGAGDTTTFSASDRGVTCYVHPAIRRVFPFVQTEDNLVNMLPQALFAFQVAQYKPEDNASKSHAIASDYGTVGPTIPTDGVPVFATHWGAGIVQPVTDIDYETLLHFPSFYDAVVLDGTKLHVVRLKHLVYTTVISAMQPYFKALGTTSNLQAAKDAISLRLGRWVDQERIQDFSVGYQMDHVNDHLLLFVGVQRFGSADTITMTFKVTGDSIEAQ